MLRTGVARWAGSSACGTGKMKNQYTGIMDAFGFEKLRVYQNARALVRDVYSLLREYPVEERYALCDQMRRSAISIPSNIAEGMGRYSVKEQAHFLEIANGSLMELYCQLGISKDLCYISEDIYGEMRRKTYELAIMLSKLHELRK